MITKELMASYLANVITIANADNEIKSNEMDVIGNIGEKLGADETIIQSAMKMAAGDRFRMIPVGRFSDKVRNLEDIMLTAMIDGELSESEKKVVVSFAKQIKISRDQLKIIAAETKLKINLRNSPPLCPDCGCQCTPEDKFCTACGCRLVTD